MSLLQRKNANQVLPPKTSIRLVDTMVNRLFYQQPDIEYSSVRSFCLGRFDPNLNEEAGFNQKTCQYKRLVLPQIKDFGSKDLSISKDDMINNDARPYFYPFGCLKPFISLILIEKSRKWVKSNPKS